jgi:hypothetical protein
MPEYPTFSELVLWSDALHRRWDFALTSGRRLGHSAQSR